jgi:NAD(P)H-hydrate repair Nnr-like enzyme with NAD(P)H-hydrate dehydratase domain
MMEFLTEALGTATPLVLDAGALDLVPALLAASGGGPAAGAPSPLPPATVLTPHAGELTALLTHIDDEAEDLERTDVEADPARWARRAAALTGSVVLIKGHRTVIAAPNGRLWLPTPGPATLATAGSGDVLAGLVGAALATGMREGVDPAGRAAELAALAVVLHNRAGLHARSASAIAQAVPAALIQAARGAQPARGDQAAPSGHGSPAGPGAHRGVPHPTVPRPTAPGGHPHAS